MSGSTTTLDTPEAVSPTTDGVPSATLSNRSNHTVLKDYGSTRQDLELETFDLIAKVNELLNSHALWQPDGTYTFADGERWAKLEDDSE